MKKLIISAFFLCSIILFCGAQEDEPIYNLKSSDVEKFINKFPAIKSDFEKMEIKYDNSSHQFTLPEGADYLNDVNSILQKNGYNDYSEFYLITASILSTYASIKLDVESDEVKPEFEEALQEIENNPAFSEEQKKQMKEYLMQSMDAMQQMSESMSTSENAKVVQPYVDKIEAILEEE